MDIDSKVKKYTDYIYSQEGEKIKRFIIEIGENRVILSNPVVTPNNEYEFVDMSHIIYFYHDFIIEKNLADIEGPENGGNATSNNWVKIAEKRVFEDSCTQILPGFIDNVINFDIRNNSKKHFVVTSTGNEMPKTSTTDYRCKEYFELEGYNEEDNYAIVKYCTFSKNSLNFETKNNEPRYYEYYKIYFSCGDTELNLNHIGFSAYISESDLLEIKSWAEDFIEYTAELTKKHIREEIQSNEIKPYFSPGVFREYLKRKYPEDLTDFEKIFLYISNNEIIAERYYKWIVGESVKKELIIIDSQTNQEYSISSLVKDGMKDWEACKFLIDLTIKNSKR